MCVCVCVCVLGSVYECMGEYVSTQTLVTYVCERVCACACVCVCVSTIYVCGMSVCMCV